MRALVNRITAHHFRFSVRGHEGDIDIALDGESSLGPNPKELALAALCGCTGTDVTDIMTKFRVPFSQLELEARGTLTEKHPKIFSAIQLTYRVRGENLDVGRVSEAVSRSLHQYSGMAAMLSKTCPITYRVLVNEIEVASGQAEFSRPAPN